MSTVPVTDTIAHALMQLVDDSNNNGTYREPTHADIEFHVNQAGLGQYDPKQQGQQIGKAKRVRAVLYAAMDANQSAASRFAAGLLAKVRACGGFRDASPNFVGREAIENAKAAFDAEGFVLAEDGGLSPKLLTSLHGVQLTEALAAYARRAQRGAEDAALVAGTGKDLLEATAAHALETLQGRYPANANFQGLLGMAFVALELAVPEIPEQSGEPPVKAMERGLFLSALGVNRVRNKQGTGHGRPWLPTLSDEETKAAIEIVGMVSAYMLAKLARRERRGGAL
ncbi:abortive infection family protein [Methylibium petroleiphilum]|uniref:abortive infection family protein n=1 Tax=Methylibium petroleiphilum TaxID=105560 RepID=UPI003D279D64